MTTPVFVYDFTLGKDFSSTEDIKTWLNEWCKKWTFQLEKGEKTGYEHYQGRFSLKAKQRKHNVLEKMPWQEIHLAPTCKQNMGNDFYVTKVDGRLDGPWKDTDPAPIILPPHLAAVKEWNPMQAAVLRISQEQKQDVFNRKINLMVDYGGCEGKSILVDSICIRKLGIKLPPLNNYKDIMQYFHSKDLSITEPTIVFFDMPRALKKEAMYQMISACESIKDGWAYDTRYGTREDKYFARPVMWIFSNNDLDRGDLSKDRWISWTVKNGELVPYEEPAPVKEQEINELQLRSIAKQVLPKPARSAEEQIADELYGGLVAARNYALRY